jgi:hypothetical protein
MWQWSFESVPEISLPPCTVYEQQERTTAYPHRTQKQSQQIFTAYEYVKKYWKFSVFLTVLQYN